MIEFFIGTCIGLFTGWCITRKKNLKSIRNRKDIRTISDCLPPLNVEVVVQREESGERFVAMMCKAGEQRVLRWKCTCGINMGRELPIYDDDSWWRDSSSSVQDA